jgi:hypothetical protein
MYGKYYPLLGTQVPGNTAPITGGTITLKDSQSNAMKYKFASVVISTDQTPPQGAQLIAQYKLPVGGNSFASMTNYVFGVLVQ